MVQAANGGWYFLTHHGTGDWSGRVMSLLPVTWVNGWFIIGEVGKDTIGRMVWQGTIPIKGTRSIIPQTDDEFKESGLLPQWEWNYQPKADKWSLTEKPGWLTLNAFKPLEADNLLKAGNTLTQRSFRSVYNEVTVKLDIGHMADGQKADLCHLTNPNYAQIGIHCQGNTRNIEFKQKDAILPGPVVTGNTLWLRSTWGLDGLSRFYYSSDGENFVPFGDAYQLRWGSYRGDRIGIYTYNSKADEGYVYVDYFHYIVKK